MTEYQLPFSSHIRPLSEAWKNVDGYNKCGHNDINEKKPVLILPFSPKTFSLSALRPLSKFCSVIYDEIRGKKNVSICVANNNDLKGFLSLLSCLY